MFSSVGTKESGTRFLTYVDAVLGFKHLLTTADLDKALSLCTGMRGKLRSRFLVLSDDRVLPPAPVRPRGKRKQDSTESGEATQVFYKRTRGRSVGGVPGVSPIPSSANTAVHPQTQARPVVSQPGSSQTQPLPQPMQSQSVYQGAAKATNSFLRHFNVPPPVLEVNEAPTGSDQSSIVEDWASAHSDETLIACEYLNHFIYLMFCYASFKYV